MKQRRISVMSNGTQSYFPVLLRYRTIVQIGHSHKYWQTAMAEGRRMAKEELLARQKEVS